MSFIGTYEPSWSSLCCLVGPLVRPSHSFLKNTEKFAKDLDLSKNWMNDYAPSIKYIHNFVFDLLYVRCCFVFGRKIQLLFCGFWSLVIESSSALWQVREFWNFQRQGRKQSYTLDIVFFLKMLWFFWTLPVLLQRWCSTCLVCTYTDTEGKQRKARVWDILKSSKKHNI